MAERCELEPDCPGAQKFLFSKTDPRSTIEKMVDVIPGFPLDILQHEWAEGNDRILVQLHSEVTVAVHAEQYITGDLVCHFKTVLSEALDEVTFLLVNLNVRRSH